MKEKYTIYSGTEIDSDKINKIKEIASKRYDEVFYLSSYNNINNVEELSYFHGIPTENENLILGDDWFLLFEKNDEYVKFLEWVALESEEKNIHQAIQMLNVFRSILIENKDRLFYANMRHDTSYAFYTSMLEKEYFQELFHIMGVDKCDGIAPQELNDLNINMFSENSDVIKEHPEYLKYILHFIGFCVTDKFIQREKKLMKR